MSVNYYNKDTGKLVPVANGTLYADAPIGAIIPYGGTTAPTGWLLCQGQAVSRTTYAELFKAIGTAFGEGDSSTTFNVPDLRETVPVGSGSRNSDVTTHDIYTVGQFKDDQLQGHWHGGKTWVNTAGWVDGSGHLKTTANGGTDPSSNGYSSDGHGEPRVGDTTHGKQLGVNYIIKAKQTPVPVDFIDAMNEKYKASPYELNRSSNVTAFNRKWLVTGNSIVWTATHTGRLTIRCLKHGDGYSLYLTNQNSVMLDSYDNFFSDGTHDLTISEASITLQAWVRKGDVIELSTNLPANTDWTDKYFVQTGLLLYNDNFD